MLIPGYTYHQYENLHFYEENLAENYSKYSPPRIIIVRESESPTIWYGKLYMKTKTYRNALYVVDLTEVEKELGELTYIRDFKEFLKGFDHLERELEFEEI